MKMMRVCSRSRAQNTRLAQKLGGQWVSENVLATSLPSIQTAVSLELLGQLELGTNILYCPPDIQASIKSTMKVQNLNRANPPVNRRVLFINNKLDKVKKREVVLADSVSRYLVNMKRFQLLNLNVSILNDREISALGSLIFRSYLKIYLPQMIRTLRTGFLRGYLNPTTMLQVAEDYGDKFVIAAIKLAQRGFKSKRFKQRELKVGERVHYYYDSANIIDVLSKYEVGIVATFSNSLVVLTNGLNYEYNEALGIAGVWPMEP